MTDVFFFKGFVNNGRIEEIKKGNAKLFIEPV